MNDKKDFPLYQVLLYITEKVKTFSSLKKNKTKQKKAQLLQRTLSLLASAEAECCWGGNCQWGNLPLNQSEGKPETCLQSISTNLLLLGQEIKKAQWKAIYATIDTRFGGVVPPGFQGLSLWLLEQLFKAFALKIVVSYKNVTVASVSYDTV